ncbi:MAG: FmdB family zinc ribbon protein [Balneolaceae bacterium]|nr:FmdB family zinc ribbon protein [Balneolaceae bacterium]
MPTYEYKREDGTTFEVMQGINEQPLEQCPETGQKVKRVITGGGGVVYKGDGFYITDYKNKEQKNGNGTASNGQEKAESTSEPSKAESE